MHVATTIVRRGKVKRLALNLGKIIFYASFFSLSSIQKNS